jgi:NitT/TauT family transport system permease protein
MGMFEEYTHARRRAKLPMPRNLDFVYPLLLIVAGILTWWLWIRLGHVPQYLWPSLGDTTHTVVHSHELRSASWTTIRLIVIGFLLACGLGITLAALVVTFKPFEIGVFPILVGTQFVPLIALAPLFIIWFGFGETPQLVIICLFGYFSVFIATLTGLRAIDQEKLYLAQIMHAGPIATFFKIRFPAALPQIFGGLKIAVTGAVIGAVVAEFTVGSSGLGSIILRASGNGDSVTLVAGVIYLGVIGAVSFGFVGLVERFAVPWNAAKRSRNYAAAG